jgi:hypothetical protein
MVFVLVAGVGLAALRNASDLWAGMMLLVALASVGVAVLGAVLMDDRERAWWLGFAVFGGGYLVAALSPVRSELATTHLLEYVTARVGGSQVATFEVSRMDGSTQLFRLVTQDGGVIARKLPDSVVSSTPTSDLLTSMVPANRWLSALPGAASHDPFLRVGHSLFALLAGLVGGMIGTWFHSRRGRVTGTAGSPPAT